MRRIDAGAATLEDFAALVHAVDHNDELYWRLPLRELPELKNLAPYYDDWLDHPSYDSYWSATAPREAFEQITGAGPQHRRVVRPVPRRDPGQLRRT